MSSSLPDKPDTEKDEDKTEEEADGGDDHNSRDDCHLSDQRSGEPPLLH